MGPRMHVPSWETVGAAARCARMSELWRAGRVWNHTALLTGLHQPQQLPG